MSDVKIGLIGGSGLGQLLGSAAEGKSHVLQTPFGPPSGAIVETSWNGLPVFLLGRHGVGHVLSPSAVPYRANIFALKMLGVTHIIASGAVGSLREQFKPRDLVIPTQIIDKTHRRIPTFYESAAVHVEFAEPFCPYLRKVLLEAGAAQGQGGGSPPAGPLESAAGPAAAQGQGNAVPPVRVHDGGCYVCMEGPAFSTRAESLMHRLWGGDLIGMTAMPEAKLAREAEIAYALVALVTDYDCWRNAPATKTADQNPAELLKEIIANLKSASDNALALIRRAVERMAADPSAAQSCAAHDALNLAIWSDKYAIPAQEIEKLAPLWGKHFAREANPAAAS